ncbi:DUF397 domain-containing protein [Streptomyces sp. XY332]|uniref:DUF397 domain-containing protein n=1 Tax=Streptomyces sp. XY332 TaxID=1415561 RepID=UPI001F31FF68|nr:DUF397 domain-containing protein [Streptomyces sp. XY332]
MVSGRRVSSVVRGARGTDHALAGSCVEVAITWRKSSCSSGKGGQRVEVAACPATVHVGDSKVPAGPPAGRVAGGLVPVGAGLPGVAQLRTTLYEGTEWLQLQALA